MRRDNCEMARSLACVFIVGLVLLASGRVDASDAPPRAIAVALCDRSNLPRVISHKARQQLIRTFRAIGVGVTMARCGERQDGDSFRISILVLPPTSQSPAGIPGTALGAVSWRVDENPVAWIFYERIDRAAHRADVDRAIVLGHVMAHEIAHALLPVAPHAPSGLMRATWRNADLVDAMQGRLRFSGDEAAAIRDRLRLSPAAAPSIGAATAVD